MQFEEQVYYSLLGEMTEDSALPWVESAFAPGSVCEEQYERMLDAYGRLRQRLGARVRK